MKSIADIYEVWCFLNIRKILTHELGFKERYSKCATLRENSYFGYDLNAGNQGGFEFKREDGIIVSLKHEPRFNSNKAHEIRSYLATQIPDILLKAKFPNGKDAIWLFDAKYRIKKPDQWDRPEDGDKVPEDALNQMHRYRDALIHKKKLLCRTHS